MPRSQLLGPVLATLLIVGPSLASAAQGGCGGVDAKPLGVTLDGARWEAGGASATWSLTGAGKTKISGISAWLLPPSGQPVQLGSAPASQGALAFSTLGLADGAGYRVQLLPSPCGNPGTSPAFAVDNTGPIVSLDAPGGWATGPVDAVARASDAGSGAGPVEAVLDGVPVTGPSPLTLRIAGDGVHALQTTAQDRLGNPSALASAEVRIDGTPPVSTADLPSGPVAGTSRGVAFAASDAGSGVAAILAGVDGGSLAPMEGDLLVEGEGTHALRWQAVDVAGNVEPLREAVLVLDATAPRVALALQGEAADGWFRGPVQVLATPDEEAAVVGSRDGDAWEAWEGPWTLEGDGVHEVRAKATDLAGNVGPEALATVPIDATPPALALRAEGTQAEGWFVDKAWAVAEASDATSGLAALEMRLDGGAWQAGPNLFVQGEGLHLVEARARDAAGHLSEASLEVVVDAAAPVLRLVLNGTRSASGWYISRVLGLPEASDAGSGLASVELRLDGGPWRPAGNGYGVFADGPHTLEARATDRAGHVSLASASFLLDQTPPKARLESPEPGRAYQNSKAAGAPPVGTEPWLQGGRQRVVASATDGLSGVSRVVFSVDGDPRFVDLEAPFEWDWSWGPMAGRHKLKVTVEDRAGLQDTDERTVMVWP